MKLPITNVEATARLNNQIRVKKLAIEIYTSNYNATTNPMMKRGIMKKIVRAKEALTKLERMV